MENFGCRPAQYLQDLGWLGTRTSYSHGIYLSEPDLDGIAKDQTSIVHCPISNARGSLGETGIAPVWEMLERGINVALGVDGSAGNDSSNLREEMRWARTMQGARPEATYLKPSQVLGMATRGGSLLLNWPAIGSLEVGKAADLAIFPLNTLEQAGSWDPLTAFVSTQATPAETVMINGRVILDKGEFTTVDLPHLLENVRASMRILRERL
jgi:cytosine/adenosine deaminase-related metal-dependent hydrolase